MYCASNVTFKRIIPWLVTPWNNLSTCLLHGISPLSPLLYCPWFKLWQRGYLCHMSLRRKIYWTDGNTINMASMDGSNSKVLHQNQRDPVGQCSLPKRTLIFICLWSRPSVAADKVIWMRKLRYIDGATSVQEYVSMRVKVNFTLSRGPYLLMPDVFRLCQLESQQTPTIAQLSCLQASQSSFGLKGSNWGREEQERTPGNK